MNTSVRVSILLLAFACVNLPHAASAVAPGNTRLGKRALKLNTGMSNTAIGENSMNPNAQCAGPAAPLACCTGVGLGTCGNGGDDNTAVGAYSLISNVSGDGNTGIGGGALQSNTSGQYNTAVGAYSLFSNVSGDSNTGIGGGALQFNTSGQSNTAVGFLNSALNTVGSYNTALGDSALVYNVSSYNTAVGQNALNANTIGNENTAVGRSALAANTTGYLQVAVGTNALIANQTGVGNVAVGVEALFNSTGSANIAIGNAAGYQQTTGSDNIYIANQGNAGESGAVRIGNSQHAAASNVSIQGIFGAGCNGSLVPVYVDNTGKLGVGVSSERFKIDIRDIGDRSKRLLDLRPVTFKYKPEQDPSGMLQYGLVAEEVEKVYPELVAYDRDGKVLTVKYQFIPIMVLKELQDQHRQIEAQRDVVRRQTREIAALRAQSSEVAALRAQVNELSDLRARLTSLEAVLGVAINDRTVARGRVERIESHHTRAQ